MIPTGREFYKLSGSGNDFVFVDARREAAGRLEEPEVVQAVCARGTGVGADGIVFLLPSKVGTLRIRYLNSDGSLASLCGNATLCATRLAVELGAAPRSGFTLETDAGVLPVRMLDGRGGSPEIDFEPVTEVRPDVDIPLEPGEHRLGFALAGVPHLVVLCRDARLVEVARRGAPLRHHPSLRQGANVNFVSRAADGGWLIRTFERGVEGETLACGTGAVASAVLLDAWGESPGGATLTTRSGRPLRVRLARRGESWLPSLSGEARVIYRGVLAEGAEPAGEPAPSPG